MDHWGRNYAPTEWKKKIKVLYDNMPKRERGIIEKYRAEALSYVLREKDASIEKGVPVRLDPPKKIWGNFQIWTFTIDYMKTHVFGLKRMTPRSAEILGEIQASLTFSKLRSVNDGTCHKFSSRTFTDHDSRKFIARMIEAHEILKDLYDQSRSAFSREVNSICRSEEPCKHKTRLSVAYGDMLAFTIMDTFHVSMGEKDYMFSGMHFERLIELFHSLTNLMTGLGEINLKGTPEEFLSEFLSLIGRMVQESPEAIGEWIKAARNILVARMAVDDVLDSNPAKSLAATYSLEKREWALEIISVLKSYVYSDKDAANVANVYKCIPHPDANMSEMWESIAGLKEPNRIDPKQISRFRGTTRRTLYRSLMSAKHDVRLKEKSDFGDTLRRAANATQVKISQVAGMSSLAWDEVTFLPVRTLTPPSSMKVPPSDKSSQMAAEVSATDFTNLREWAMGSDDELVMKSRDKFRPVNDVVSELTGCSELSTPRSIRRFEKVIRIHEAFESKFRGVEIEDIPQEDFERFIMDNPEASYIVGTEPKAGEFHKKITRLFYMAEQNLKTITQISERLARQVSRSQTGVSITKSYTARRKDLEQFCESMTGPTANKVAMFVSFDMSEFSKKFPMRLIREYGAILAELTGEEWLKRLDLVFRASIVIHNTRNYGSYLAGVKGGFEGFLNFIWSSIHAIIMEIALEATGLSGHLLTFSDDGLLMFIFPEHLGGKMLRQKIESIKGIYLSLGLNFHLSKTLVSTCVWEYLGDICVDNKILPMWFKELSRVGLYDMTKGVNTLHTIVSATIGQARSLARAGCTAETAYILMHLYTLKRLRRMNVRMTSSQISALMIVPFSCSGFRVPSPIELSTSTCIESSSEFYADLLMLEKMDPEVVGRICSHIGSNLVSSSRDVQLISNSQRIAATLPDTSGLSVTMKLLEALEGTTDISIRSNPLGPSSISSIRSLLANATVVEPSVISKIITACPSYVDFTRSVALIKSNGARKLLSRKVRRQAQARDTYNCKRSMELWLDALTSHAQDIYSPAQLYNLAYSKIFKHINLSYMKPSGRTYLRLTEENADIIVTISTEECRSLVEQGYQEPRIKFPQPDVSLSWFAQASGDPSKSTKRNFLKVVAEAVSMNPHAVKLFVALANVLGCSMPFIPAGPLANLKRMSAGGSSRKAVDIMICPPRPQWALSTVRFSGRLQSKLSTMKSADRTTYLELARVMAIEIVTPTLSQLATQKSKTYTVRFMAVPEMDDAGLVNPMMEIREDENIPQRLVEYAKDRDLISEFQTSINEFHDLRSAAQQVADMTHFGTAMTEEERDTYTAILTESLARWIVESLMTSHSPVLPYQDIPIPMFHRMTVVRNAILKAAWRLLSPSYKSSFIPMTRLGRMGDYGLAFAEVRQVARERFMSQLHAVTDAFLELNLDVIPLEHFSNINKMQSDMSEALAEVLRTETLLPKLGGKLVVIRSGRDSAGRMSASHRVAYRQAFSNTIALLMDLGRDLSWDTTEMARATGLVNIDSMIDWLFICRDLVRESSHRSTSHPYNSVSALIESFKFYRALSFLSTQPGAIDRIMVENERGVKVADMNSIKQFIEYFRLDFDEEEEIYSTASSRELGPDHHAMISQPLLETVAARIAHHVSAMYYERPLIKDYDAASDVSSLRLDQHVFYQLVISKAASKIIDVPRQVAHMLTSSFSPSPKEYIESFNIEVTPGHLGGECWYPDEVLKKDEATNLCTELLLDYTTRHGIGGISLNATSNQLITKMVDRLGIERSSSPTLAYDSTLTGEEADLYLVCREFTDPNDAMTTYINLIVGATSSITIFRESESKYFYVIGITSFKGLYKSVGGVKIPMVYAKDYSSTTELIPQCTVREMEASIQHSLRPFISGPAYREVRTGVSAMRASYLSACKQATQVNASSSLLHAATSLYSASKDSQSMLWGYILFRGYLKSLGGDDISLTFLREKYNKAIDILDDGVDEEVNRLRQDIGAVGYYLIQSNIVAGRDVDFEATSTLIKRRPKAEPSRYIGLVPCYGSLKKITELHNYSDKTDDQEIWHFLFLKNDPPGYQGLDDQNGEQSSSGSDEEDGDDDLIFT